MIASIDFTDSRNYRNISTSNEDLSERGLLYRAAYSLSVALKAVYEVFRGPRDVNERIRLTENSKLNQKLMQDAMVGA